MNTIPILNKVATLILCAVALNGVIPKVFQKLVLGCVKAPAVEFPQVGLYLEHKTHLRESQPRGFDAAQDQLLKRFGYILGDNKVASPEEIQKISRKEQVTIEDIKTMNNAGITDDKIISLIKSTGSVYHLSSADVEDLKRAGVSKRVINYMLQTPYQ